MQTDGHTDMQTHKRDRLNTLDGVGGNDTCNLYKRIQIIGYKVAETDETGCFGMSGEGHVGPLIGPKTGPQGPAQKHVN